MVRAALAPRSMDTDSHAPGTPISQEEELPKPADIEIELNDIYRHDEEQAFITLMSQEVKSLNFAAEANYTVRLCKEIVAYHYPDKMPLGSFELVASNKVRSDEETLGEVFNGDPYACDPPKEPADDPCFDWVPRKEQIFDEHKLMQLSIWKKEWDEDNKCYEPVDLGCARARAPPRRHARDRPPRVRRCLCRYMAYGYEQTRKWRKMGYLNEKGYSPPPTPTPPRHRRTQAWRRLHRRVCGRGADC